MNELQTINDMLAQASKLLDEAAKKARNIPFETKRDVIRRIGEALVSVFDVQRKIYEIEPSLEPEYLKQQNPYPGESKKFGNLLIKADDLCLKGNPQEAISLLQEYIGENPPEYFAKMANGQIDNIRNKYSV